MGPFLSMRSLYWSPLGLSGLLLLRCDLASLGTNQTGLEMSYSKASIQYPN